MSTPPTTREIRGMIKRRWTERDAYGVWFWGSWLLMRWNVLPIIVGVVSAVVGLFIARMIAGTA